MSCLFLKTVEGGFFSNTEHFCLAEQDKKLDDEVVRDFCKSYDWGHTD